MAQLQIAYLPRRGTEERWRRLCQDVAELCPEQFAAVCQQAGITQVQGLLGWDVQEVLADPPTDLLFTWQR